MAHTTDPADELRVKTTAWNVADHLRSPEEIAAYLNAWLEEAPDDTAGITRAVGDIARAQSAIGAPGRQGRSS
jgi:DNA-binding phage protein